MERIAIVGVGALGSHLVLLTRNLPVTIKVIDMDSVESKNTMSQFHTKMALQKNKAMALKQTMHGLFGTKIEAVPHRLTLDNVESLLSGMDLVVDCLDNGASRKIVQDYVQVANIPCLHGALAPDGTFGRVVWTHQFVIDSEAGMGTATCDNGEHLPFIVTVASYMAMAVQQFIRSGTSRGYQVWPGGCSAI